MTELKPVPISEKDLAFLQGVDSPTIANAIEPFKVRDRTEGFIGGEVRCLFPEMAPMVGTALTVTMTNTPEPVAGPLNGSMYQKAMASSCRITAWRTCSCTSPA